MPLRRNKGKSGPVPVGAEKIKQEAASALADLMSIPKQPEPQEPDPTLDQLVGMTGIGGGSPVIIRAMASALRKMNSGISRQQAIEEAVAESPMSEWRYDWTSAGSELGSAITSYELARSRRESSLRMAASARRKIDSDVPEDRAIEEAAAEGLWAEFRKLGPDYAPSAQQIWEETKRIRAALREGTLQ